MSTEHNEGMPLTYQESVEETLARAKKEREEAVKKSKKRKKIILIIAIILVVLIALVVGISVLLTKLTPPMVSTVQPQRGTIESNVLVSGTLESDQCVQYTVPAAIIVDSIASVGTEVSKGDLLVSFEKDDFESVMREFELENQIASNSYQSQLKEFEQNKKDLSTANANVSKYRNLRDQQQATVNHLTATITDANALRAAQIEVEIYECQKKIDEYSYCIQNAEMLGMGKEGIEAYTRYIFTESQKIAELQFELSQLSGSVQALEQQKQLTDAQKLLADYEAELAEAEAKSDSLEGIVGNEFDEQNVYLNGELNLMRANKTYEEIEIYKDGLKADMNGVVIVSSAKPGEKTVPGSVLLTVASTDKVKIGFDVSKNDMVKLEVGQKADVTVMDKEYIGTVTKVNRVAVMNETGAYTISAEISIDNPDEQMYLGLEGKIVIHTAKKEDVVMLPVQVICSDSEGDFVYCVENGIIVKRYLTLGISSDEYIEVIEGVSEEDIIVSAITTEVAEGKRMTPIPDMMLKMQMEMTSMPEDDAIPEEMPKEDTEGISEEAALPKEEEE
ncbi:MAG: efflux RND transporter periplasmic adaptor subunit [Lachnospiraceae bacterium]|nr:efflux RND transporter periplasmic adaptor subunit [Lachnospiraceae bacterium]